MNFKAEFTRFAGLSTLPGFDEGVKDEAYQEGLSAGRAVVQAINLGWAKSPKDNTKKAWMPIVAKYAGEQEFEKDSQWGKGFGSALTGHFGKDMKLEDVQEASALHHGTVRQWQNGRHLKNGASWERLKTGRPQGYASKMPTVLDVVQGNVPPEALGPPIAAMPSLGVVGASAPAVESMTVNEALDILNAQLSGEEQFDEGVMKMVFGVLRKLGGKAHAAKPKAHSTSTPISWSISKDAASMRKAREHKRKRREME